MALSTAPPASLMRPIPSPIRSRMPPILSQTADTTSLTALNALVSVSLNAPTFWPTVSSTDVNVSQTTFAPFHMVWMAPLIPSNAGTAMLFHSQEILSPTTCMAALRKSNTAPAAVLMPSQMTAHILRPVSVLVKNAHSATPTATTAAMMRPMGFADIATLSAHCAAAASLVPIARLRKAATIEDRPDRIEAATVRAMTMT